MLHGYRTPFPRSSGIIHLPLRPADAMPGGGTVWLTRPRGYLGVARNVFTIDGGVPDGVTPGVPAVATTSRRFSDIGRAVRVVLDDEAVTVRTFTQGHVVIAEFHH